jgi:hypothetical protein
MEKGPSYDGKGLVNLVAEIERRLTGGSPCAGLSNPDAVPDADSYVLVLFDGLGVAQLENGGASILRSSLADVLEAPFATTTSVSLATVATGLPPARHGQVAHLSWYPDLDLVVNTLKWVTLGGDHVPYEYSSVLPRPNLWERLRDGGVEPITVQPGDFNGSPLSRVTYRGARFEGAWDAADLADATVTLAGEPGRFVFTYVPFVDVAGHVHGQASVEFSQAMKAAAEIWSRIGAALPPGVALLGTADHGLMEVTEEHKVLVRDPAFDGLRFAGDARGVHLWGDSGTMRDLTAATGGTLVDPAPLLGPDPTDASLAHTGQSLLLAPPGKVILPRGFDKRLRCYHGGLMAEEVKIPLLVG